MDKNEVNEAFEILLEEIEAVAEGRVKSLLLTKSIFKLHNMPMKYLIFFHSLSQPVGDTGRWGDTGRC